MKICEEKVRTHGFTLVEIVIVVSIIGLLAMMAIPAYARSRAHAAEVTCERNLRQMADAKDQWALEVRKGKGVQPKDKDIFGPNAYIFTKPTCPAGGSYDLNKLKELPTCTVIGHELE